MRTTTTANTKNLTQRLVPIALLFLILCYNDLTTTTPMLRPSPSSSEEKNNNIATNNIPPPDIYWGKSCPLEVSSFSISSRTHSWLTDPTYLSSPIAESYDSFTQRARNARDTSLAASTRPRVLHAWNTGALSDRNVVFVGDSLTRQTFISFGCLAYDEMIYRHVTPFFPDRKHGLFYDARFEWKGGGGGQVFYAPTAGKIYRYNWKAPPDGPIVSGDDDETMNSWLESCQQGLPFEFETYSYDDDNYPNPNDGTSSLPKVEKITLSSRDVVFLNAGFHEFREEGHANLLALVSCMEQQQQGRNKEESLFPHLVYITSSVQHFDMEHTLTNASGQRIKKCTNVVSHNPNMEQELKLYRHKLPMIGEDVDLLNRGDLHVIGEKTDCTHWFQPGIPDLYAAKAAEVVVQVAMGVDLMINEEEEEMVLRRSGRPMEEQQERFERGKIE